MDNPNNMWKLAVDFYSGQCDEENVSDHFQDIPKLQPKQKETLDCDISLRELKVAVKQLSLGHSPGIDGITADFYHHFWNILGHLEDFCEITKECFENGYFPSSCLQAVLSLLPKKGDLGFLKNWRSVSRMYGLHNFGQMFNEHVEMLSGHSYL